MLLWRSANVAGVLTTALLVALAASLTACGVHSDDTPSTRRLAPTISSDGFTVRVPEGWTNETRNAAKLGYKSFPDSRIVLLFEAPIPGTYEKNVNDLQPVIRADIIRPTYRPSDYAAYLRAPSDVPETNRTPIRRTRLGGEPAAFYSADVDESGTPARGVQYIVTHNGVTYQLEYENSAASFGRRLSDFRAVLRSLRWK
jgi:hypothetical protein